MHHDLIKSAVSVCITIHERTRAAVSSDAKKTSFQKEQPDGATSLASSYHTLFVFATCMQLRPANHTTAHDPPNVLIHM